MSASTSPAPVAAPSRQALAGLAWGLLGVVSFSMTLPATGLAVRGGLDPWFISMGREVIAGVFAAVVLLARGVPRPTAAQARRLAIVALGVVFGWPVLTALALRTVPASHASVVTGVLPAATAVAAVLRAGERPSRWFWAAALLGMACVVGFAAVHAGGHVSAGDALLAGAVALCALGYAEGGALAGALGGGGVICWVLVLSLPLTIPATVLAWNGVVLARADPSAWLGFAYVSSISAFAGFFAWYRGLALGGVARVGQVQLAQPLLSLLWAGLLLGERITPAMLVTSVAVILCVVATQRAH